MPEVFTLVVIAIVLALIFDFGNGLNDAANAIATVVATKALPLWGAVLLAAIGNFAGVFLFGVAVATTIAKDLVETSAVDVYVVLSGLIGAILWVYFATHKGIPVSASHALIGGFIGSALTKAGINALKFGGIAKVLVFIAVAPVLGMAASFVFFTLIAYIFKNFEPKNINKYFKRLQLISASFYSVAHGANDAQKVMGIIAILLFSTGFLGNEFFVPLWVIFASYTVIALGTLTGGWRVIKTMGMRLTRLMPVHGFCAESAGSLVLAMTGMLGIPVSTTHVIAGSIVGVGAARRFSAVRWNITRKILWAWILTVPVSAIVGGLSYLAVSLSL